MSYNWCFLCQLVSVSMRVVILVTLLSAPARVRAACPFQNPFSFLDPPSVVSVVDKDGKVAADRVRVTWGKVKFKEWNKININRKNKLDFLQVDNFKCVDFFQIEYYEEHDPVGTVQMSAKINKNRKSFDIPIKPCSDYRFKVIFKYEFNLKSTNMVYFGFIWRWLLQKIGKEWERISKQLQK